MQRYAKYILHATIWQVHSTCNDMPSTFYMQRYAKYILHATICQVHSTCNDMPSTFYMQRYDKYILHAIDMQVHSTCISIWQVHSTCHIDACRMYLSYRCNVECTCHIVASTIYMSYRYASRFYMSYRCMYNVHVISLQCRQSYIVAYRCKYILHAYRYASTFYMHIDACRMYLSYRCNDMTSTCHIVAMIWQVHVISLQRYDKYFHIVACTICTSIILHVERTWQYRCM